MTETRDGHHVAGATLGHLDLTGAHLTHVDLTRTTLHSMDLSQARLRGVDLRGLQVTGAEAAGVRLDGEIAGLVVNGVDVTSYVEEELDRRDPERARMRPAHAAGFREAWDIIERRWGDTVVRAQQLDPDLLHRQVEGEWSFIETLRHLAFATDAWIRRCLLGDPAPWHPLDLPWDEAPDFEGVPRDRTVRPSLEAVLELRRDRMATVREVVDHLTDNRLDATTTPVEGPGWPPPEAIPVREVLLVVLNEEWCHRQFAERDLSVLENLEENR